MSKKCFKYNYYIKQFILIKLIVQIFYIIEICIKIELIIKRVKLLNFFIFKSTSTQIIVDDGIIEIISYIIKGLNIEERYYYGEDYH